MSSFCAFLMKRQLLAANPVSPRGVAIFLIPRYAGMRRDSVATLCVRHVDPAWALRGVRVKGGKTRDNRH